MYAVLKILKYVEVVGESAPHRREGYYLHSTLTLKPSYDSASLPRSHATHPKIESNPEWDNYFQFDLGPRINSALYICHMSAKIDGTFEQTVALQRIDIVRKTLAFVAWKVTSW